MANKGYAAMVKDLEKKGTEEALAPKKKLGNPKIISGATPEPNTPVLRGPDPELNWVQKMTKQIHSYLTRKKKESKV